MNTIKQWFSAQWAKILIVGVAIVALVAWVIDSLLNKNSTLQTQVQQVKDQKQADVLESQIGEELADASLKQKQVDTNNSALAQLEQKREELPKQKDLSAEQVQNYWKQDK